MAHPGTTCLQTHTLDQALAALDAVRSEAQTIGRRYAFDDPWAMFIRKMRLLTPQSYGARVQNRLAEHFGWTSVPAALGKGDVVDDEGDHHEIKVSFITASNSGANFVQIRPHQNIAGYHLFVITATYDLVHFYLTKTQMAQELRKIGTAAHGTHAANQVNRNKEWAIRLDWDLNSTLLQRWLARYGRPTPQIR